MRGWSTLQPEAALRIIIVIQSRKKAMPVYLPVILVASHIVQAGNQLPKFNIDSGCQIVLAAALTPKSNLDACKRDELTARVKLIDEWSQYTPAQKARCVALTLLGGDPNYAELRTCLELAKIAKSLPPAARTTGQG
jgi:hypothetical protein